MCLSVPAEVLHIDGQRARVSVGGVLYTAGLHLVEDVHVGDYILLHSGYAIQKIDAAEAAETLALLREAATTVADAATVAEMTKITEAVQVSDMCSSQRRADAAKTRDAQKTPDQA